MKPDRAIDWPYFIIAGDDQRKSNKLDTLIASDVFDLPESAVPDVPTKFLIKRGQDARFGRLRSRQRRNLAGGDVVITS